MFGFESSLPQESSASWELFSCFVIFVRALRLFFLRFYSRYHSCCGLCSSVFCWYSLRSSSYMSLDEVFLWQPVKKRSYWKVNGRQYQLPYSLRVTRSPPHYHLNIFTFSSNISSPCSKTFFPITHFFHFQFSLTLRKLKMTPTSTSSPCFIPERLIMYGNIFLKLSRA